MKLLEKDGENHFVLPVYEAKQLQENKLVTILVKVESQKVDGYEAQFQSNYGTESQFPAIFVARDKKVCGEWANIEKKDEFKDGTVRNLILNGARLWNYFGDGTHCTEVFPTPYYLSVDQRITIENKYNVKKINCLVSNIELVRDSNLDWFWKVEIKKLTNR